MSSAASPPPAQQPAPPTQPYAPPPQYGTLPPKYQQYGPPRVPTVKSVHLGDVFFLISSMLLIAVGLENFGWISNAVRAQYLILGLVAIIAGLMLLANVVMPYLLRSMDHVMDTVIMALSMVFLFWGLIAVFADGVGLDGGFLFVAGLFGLAGVGLRMGLVK